MRQIIIRLFIVFHFVFLSLNCLCQTEKDNTINAIEISKIKNNKTYIVKIDDLVMIPCYSTKGRRKSLAVARLVEIDGTKIYFEPVNRHYRKTHYSTRSIKEIGIITTWSLIRTAYFMACRVMKKDYWGTAYDTPHSFQMFNMKSKKYKIRIIETEV